MPGIDSPMNKRNATVENTHLHSRPRVMGSVVLDNRSDGLAAAEIVDEMSSASAPEVGQPRRRKGGCW